MVTFTTTLPDEDAPVLGNGVEDEVAVDRESATTNYGSVRIQIRETGMSVWDGRATGFDEQVVAFDALQTQFTGRQDGEEYEVRARSETEHRTGAWTEPVSTVTRFPGAVNPTPDAPTTTSVTVSWTDNSDNEDGFDLQHRRQYDSGFGAWTTVATTDPDVTTATDDQLVPGETYQLRVRAFTEDAEALSSSVSVTADSLAVDSSRAPATGYRVELDHPNGQTVVPDLRDDPQYRPALNDLPTCTIPVREAEHWLAQNWEGAAIRVWRDGDRLPIDEIDAVEPTPDGVELQAIGGGELRDRVTQSYQQREAWLAVRDDLLPQVSYGAHVDDPAAGGGTTTEVQSAATTDELQDRLNNPLATDPLVVENGQVTTAQTCFTVEGEDETRGNGTAYGSGDTGRFSEDFARGVSASDEYLEWDVTTQYRIPASAVGVAGLPIQTDDAQEMELTLILEDGTSERLDVLSGGEGIEYAWDYYGNGAYNGSGWNSGDIPPGTHTLQLEATGSTGRKFGFDVVAPLYDTRFSYDFDDSDGYKSGPQTHPDGTPVVFESVTSPFNVPSGALEVQMDNTAGSQSLGITNDDGTSYQTAGNTTSFSTTFASGGSSIGARVTLGRYGSRTDATPTQGFRGQTLDSYSLTATLENSPVLINARYDDSLLSILQSIADYGDFVFELVWSDVEDRIVVEWTQSGQRTAGGELPVSDYTVSKQIGAAYDKAVIYGVAQPVDGESVSADHGTAVDLAEDILVQASETVLDASSEESYVRGSDYEIDTQAGTITTLTSGSIPNGRELSVSYEYKFRGSYTVPDASAEPRTIVKTVPSLTSDQACDIAALFLATGVSDPLYSAEIEVPRRALGIELVAERSIDALPTDKQLETWSIDESPSTARLQLGTRREVEQVVSDLQDRVSASAEQI